MFTLNYAFISNSKDERKSAPIKNWWWWGGLFILSNISLFLLSINHTWGGNGEVGVDDRDESVECSFIQVYVVFNSTEN